MNQQPPLPQDEALAPGGSSARSDLLGGVGWIVFGALVLAESLRMDRFEKMGATLYTMPGFVPGMIGAVLMLLGLVLLLRGWTRRRHEPVVRAQPLLNRRALWAGALCLVYAGLLIGRVNFMAATAIFVATFTWLFTPEDASRQRRALAAIAAGILSALVVVFVFEDVFLVRLP